MRSLLHPLFRNPYRIICHSWCLAVLGGAYAAWTGGMTASSGASINGTLAALLVLIGGLLYIVFVAGFLYLGAGIYSNTKRTAEAVERMAGR